jgi:anti-sigma factor RsiW
MPLPPVIQSIVDFVRKGYPQGVPQQDYLPLFALLRRRLSDEEVGEVVAALAADPAVAADAAAIGEAIEHVTRESPSETDIERVRRRLDEAGWESGSVD